MVIVVIIIISIIIVISIITIFFFQKSSSNAGVLQSLGVEWVGQPVPLFQVNLFPSNGKDIMGALRPVFWPGGVLGIWLWLKQVEPIYPSPLDGRKDQNLRFAPGLKV